MDFKEQEKKKSHCGPALRRWAAMTFLMGGGKPIDIYVSLFYDIHL